MAIALPSTFSDGPGNTASGVQVTANDAKVRDGVNNLGAVWRTIAMGGGQIPSGGGAATRILWAGPGAYANQNTLATGTAGSAAVAFWLDPADYAIADFTAKMRMRAWLMQNAIASGLVQTFGLYPVTGWAGVSGVLPAVNTLGTVVTDSTVSLSTAVASSQPTGVSLEFNVPAAGYYVLGVASGGTIANSLLQLGAHLQVRHV